MRLLKDVQGVTMALIENHDHILVVLYDGEYKYKKIRIRKFSEDGMLVFISKIEKGDVTAQDLLKYT